MQLQTLAQYWAVIVPFGQMSQLQVFMEKIQTTGDIDG